MQKNPRHIGIVACSSEGAALCYRELCTNAQLILGQHSHPEISMHSYSLADYVSCLIQNDMKGLGKLMLSSAHKLKSMGAEFVICPDNTIHQALPLIQSELQLPWLNIADAVASELVKNNCKRVGLTGTQWLVESNVYPEKLHLNNIDYQLPEPEHRKEMNRIIMDELVKGIVKPESITFFQQVIEGFKYNECDSVILGCTEIPLMINDENSCLPTFSSTSLLAQAALQFSLE